MKTIIKTTIVSIFLLTFAFQIVTNSEFFNILNLENYEKNKYEILNVMDYLNKNKELDQSLFNEREILHLKDVYNLFLILKLIFILSLILIFCLKDLLKPSIYSFIFSIILALIVYLINFKSLFLGFHKLVFFNNYWLLDPSKDLLINLFPAAFFQYSFYAILLLFLGLNAVLIVILYFIKKRLINF